MAGGSWVSARSATVILACTKVTSFLASKLATIAVCFPRPHSSAASARGRPREEGSCRAERLHGRRGGQRAPRRRSAADGLAPDSAYPSNSLTH